MPRPDLLSLFAALMALAVASAPALAAGDLTDANAELEEVERLLAEGQDRRETLDREATELAREVNELRTALIDAAAKAQRQEEAVTEVERRLKDLNRDAEVKSASLGQRRAELVATLGALQRLSLRPPELLLSSATSPLDTIRSSLLLKSAVPALEREANMLAGELEALSELRAEIAIRQIEFSEANTVLEKEQRALARLLTRKAALEQRTRAEHETESQRLATLSEQADNLRALILTLEEERRAREAAQRAAQEAAARVAREEKEKAARALAAEDAAQEAAQEAAREQAKAAEGAGAAQQLALIAPGEPPEGALARPFSAARGTLPLPARGRLVRKFGQATEFRTPAKGITIETRPLAQVVAPYDGRVAFAGPFRGYGLLLIIEHGEGYHTLVAGLSRIDGVVGQWVLAGEPVGQMSEGSGRKPTLYVELRRDGVPINPVPWLSTSEREVSG